MNMNAHSRRLRTAIGLGLLAAGLALGGCSAAGGELSFVGPQVEGIREFHVVTVAEGGGVRLLSGIGGLGSTLLWLPDGQRAVVYREVERDYYLADIEAGSLGECLTCAAEGLTGPAVSPDGTQIAWSGPEGIYLQDLQDGGLAQLAGLERPGWISWSPDGKQVAFGARVGSLQIYRLEVESGEILQLTHAVGEAAVEAFAPAWSPRGDEIAFHALDADGLHLMLVQASGEGLRKLADWANADEIYDPGLQAPPVWSPDGEALLWAGAAADASLDLFVVDVDGSGPSNLTNSPGDDWDPAWSPDGKFIAFITERDGDQEIYVMNSDGSDGRNVSQLPTTPETNPAWRP